MARPLEYLAATEARRSRDPGALESLFVGGTRETRHEKRDTRYEKRDILSWRARATTVQDHSSSASAGSLLHRNLPDGDGGWRDRLVFSGSTRDHPARGISCSAWLEKEAETGVLRYQNKQGVRTGHPRLRRSFRDLDQSGNHRQLSQSAPAGICPFRRDLASR